jgi:hypothetical protein
MSPCPLMQRRPVNSYYRVVHTVADGSDPRTVV